MPGTTRAYWLHTLTPTHVGIGRGMGYIDLPLYREKNTNWPAIPGSGFKGVWSDHFRATPENRRERDSLRLAFGQADNGKGDSSNAGALIPTDARLLCLPVRSLMGTFAWVTSRLALQFLNRDLQLAKFVDLPKAPEVLKTPQGNAPKELTPAYTAMTNSILHLGSNNVYLEDLDFVASQPAEVAAWADRIAKWVFPGDPTWQIEFKRRFIVVPDMVFDALAETGTEVVTRVRIDDHTKTVADGQLWTEESLPAESILYGVISCDRVYAEKAAGNTSETLLRAFATDELRLQLGGKASVGRGQTRCVFSDK
jgi:CRISPR-associated protein Cmr4